MKLEFCRQIFEKSSIIKFYEISSIGSGGREGGTDRQTDMAKLIVALRSFAKAPKDGSEYHSYHKQSNKLQENLHPTSAAIRYVQFYLMIITQIFFLGGGQCCIRRSWNAFPPGRCNAQHTILFPIYTIYKLPLQYPNVSGKSPCCHHMQFLAANQQQN
jgi:hypothetical protein